MVNDIFFFREQQWHFLGFGYLNTDVARLFFCSLEYYEPFVLTHIQLETRDLTFITQDSV